MTMQGTRPSPVTQTDGRLTAAWILTTVQAAVAYLGALFLWTWDADGRRRFVRRFAHEQLAVHPLRWGVLLLLVGGALTVSAIALAHRRSWAPTVAYVTEAIVAVGSFLRFHPARSILGLGLAATVIVLVATSGTRTRSSP